MVNLKNLRALALTQLKAAQNDSPLADIDCILKALGFDKGDILRGEKTLCPEKEQKFWTDIERLKNCEPVQYIVGSCEFMSLDFEVTPDTLIPRADTEILVETVIDLCHGIENPFIFEIGTGSGCIAVSLAHYIKGANVTSADISDAALKVAKRNAARHRADVRFIHHNIFDGFPQFDVPPDIIVSNPPYIPSRDIPMLDRKVKDFEPNHALDGGEDGLDFYRFIIDNAPLRGGGRLALEVGIGQSRAVSRLMLPRFCDIKVLCDLSGTERVVTGKLSDI